MLASLEPFEYRVYSQNGEDGVLQRVFSLLGTTNRYFVEFGTGPTGSERNTRLLEEQGWTGLLMDRAPDASSWNIRREMVTAENINSLMTKYDAPPEMDLLSIDIDGNDYWVWKAMSQSYRPRVVVIEYNAAFSPMESKAIIYDPSFEWSLTDYFGASLRALARLGRRKGYTLVYCEQSGVNAFFVRADLLHAPPAPVETLYRPMASRHHGGRYPRDPERDMIDVEVPVVSGVILARNEEHNIVDCVQALRPHVDEVVLIDMESTDRTVPLALPLVDQVLHHPKIEAFDAARNIVVPHVKCDWLWFVDADERIPEAVGGMVREILAADAGDFEALEIPFKSYFCGRWMEHCGWWPGYTGPRVVRRGRFRFAQQLHGGVELDGRLVRTPPDPALGIDHYSYSSISHYLQKLDRYTTAEARQLFEAGEAWNWRASVQAMVRRLWDMYDHRQGVLDGERGWILSWLSAQYEWISHAKLSELSDFDDGAQRPPNIPQSVGELLHEMKMEWMRLSKQDPNLPLAVVLRASVWQTHGYADDARTLAKSWSQGERPLIVQAVDETCAENPIADHEAALLRALCRGERPPNVITITSSIPGCVAPDPLAAVNILRTTSETDRIPDSWHACLDLFDEIWVMSQHNARAFRRSGVAPERLRVMPGALDMELFTPHGRKLDLPQPLVGRFVFLSVFDWQLRKGWDRLLAAFCEEFSVSDGVGLWLKITRQHGHSQEGIGRQIDQCLSPLGQRLSERPDIVIWDGALSQSEMAALYRTANAFVLATRGEGWGRPYLEAMASGLPVIGTGASGNMDFMTEQSCFLVPASLVDVPAEAVAEIPVFSGQKWYEPDSADLRAQLRAVVSDRGQRVAKAQHARRHVEAHFGLTAARQRFEAAISDIEQRFCRVVVHPIRAKQLRIELEGEFFAGHSFALVNEQVAAHLLQEDSLAVSLNRVPSAGECRQNTLQERELQAFFQRDLPGGAQVTIRHCFPPNLNVPETGKWVHIQPWEYGHLPVAWLEALRDRADEIWAPSEYVRRAYVESGVAQSKIQVIPWGIDPSAFDLEVPARLLPTAKSFVFLYVGGTIARKGFDILLQAYRQEFSPEDDACLVIKDVGASSFYRHGNHASQIRKALADSASPELIYIDHHLTTGQLASLYRAAHCLVAPYRGEGFGLPILEAAACGVVAIVPHGGPTDDYLDEEFAYFLPSHVRRCEHPWPLCGPATELAVSLEDVCRTMRRAYEHRDELEARGRCASDFVRQHFTWQNTAARMVERIQALAET